MISLLLIFSLLVISVYSFKSPLKLSHKVPLKLKAVYDLVIWLVRYELIKTSHMGLCIFFIISLCRDCDGVLVDSEALLKQGEVEALAKHGFKLTIEDCIKLFSGYSPDDATKNFENIMKKPLPPNFFKDQIEGSLQLFKDRLIPLMDNTVLKLYDNKIIQCVASGSPRNRVDISIEKAGI